MLKCSITFNIVVINDDKTFSEICDYAWWDVSISKLVDFTLWKDALSVDA